MNNSQKYPRDLITTVDAACILGVSPNTLQMRRSAGLPPRFYKFSPGRHTHVRYSRRDVLDYLALCLTEPKVKATAEVSRGRN